MNRPKSDRPDSQNSLRFDYGGIENLSEVMRIMIRSFSTIYGESWNNSQCRSMLALPGTRLLLANYKNTPCGFAITRTIIDEEELLMIAVDPSFRKLGIGTGLLDQITTRAIDENIEVIFLEVRSNNPAQALYQRLGFEKIGFRSSYYTGEDKLKYDANTFRKLLKSGKE